MKNNNNQLVVEFGSANLRIYKNDYGMLFNESNCAIIQNLNNQKTPIYFCNDAKILEGKLNETEKLCYPVLNGILKDIELQGNILEYALNKIDLKGNAKLSKYEFKITVLCGINDKDIEKYKELLKNLGIKKYSFIFQSVCISQITNIPLSQPQFIVDIGAGKTELAIVCNNKIITGVSIDLGGDMMNLGIKELLRVDNNIIASNAVIEKMKTSIGSLYISDNSNFSIWAKDNETALTKNYTIKARNVNNVFIDCHNKIISLIQSIIEDCSPEVNETISLNGIVLVGDSSRILGLKRYYELMLKIKVKVLDEYGDSVVIGGSKM